LGRIGDLLENISEKDDPKFRFVLGGMLPKLIKLHDSAQKQSFVYCLATNRLGEIDLAAKRKGRFDEKIPIYKPDALSRAGTLLYWLGQAKEIKPKKTTGKPTEEIQKPLIDINKNELRRFFEAIARTVGEPADRVSKLFKTKKDEKGNDERTKTLKYILNEQNGSSEELKASQANLEVLKREIRPDGFQDDDEGESKKRRSICKYEEKVVMEEEKLSKETTPEVIIERLNECLRFKREPEEAQEIARQIP